VIDGGPIYFICTKKIKLSIKSLSLSPLIPSFNVFHKVNKFLLRATLDKGQRSNENGAFLLVELAINWTQGL